MRSSGTQDMWLVFRRSRAYAVKMISNFCFRTGTFLVLLSSMFSQGADDVASLFDLTTSHILAVDRHTSFCCQRFGGGSRKKSGINEQGYGENNNLTKSN